ncbi:MAG: hypothetical protein NZ518_09600, partial [Dehalococcoidia bacterium]|nr:hypothetical protein [Dehalococcoidia bacterium]
LALGVVVWLSTGATLAAFTAQTVNPNNVLASGTVLMTNVAGTAVAGSNCTTGTPNGNCATLFNVTNTNLRPGDPDTVNTVTITYVGSLTTAAFGLHVANFTSRGAGSAATCTASDPASRINLQIRQGSAIIYPTSGSGYGTLAAFAAAYPNQSTRLALRGGANGSGALNVWATNDQSEFTIRINLDASADNTYQGCQTLVDFVWFASS